MQPFHLTFHDHTLVGDVTPFGPNFSRLIRRPNSWQDSDAWDTIGRFTGRLLIVTAELDNVIPPAVPPKLLSSATRAATKKLITIPGCPHATLPFLNNPANHRQFEAVYREIIQLLADPAKK
jgi:pimeloyl-ACP methyl ester carboxylesterase